MKRSPVLSLLAVCGFACTAVANPVVDALTVPEKVSTTDTVVGSQDFVMLAPKANGKRDGLRGVVSCLDFITLANCQTPNFGASTAYNATTNFLYDNFESGQAQSVGAVCFRAFIATNTLGQATVETGWEIAFFRDVNGFPDTSAPVAIRTDSGASPTMSITTSDVPSNNNRFAFVAGVPQNEREFTATFTTPVALDANQCYWVRWRKLGTSTFGNAAFIVESLPGDGRALNVPPTVTQPTGAHVVADDLTFCLVGAGGSSLSVAFAGGCSAGDPPPANDGCFNAQTVTITPGETTAVPGTTVGATADTGVPTCSVGGTAPVGVWYTFTGTGNAMLITTCAEGNDFDSIIRVYDASAGCGALVCVAGNDDSSIGAGNGFCPPNGEAALAEFCARAGVEYRVFVQNGFRAGDFTLFFVDGGAELACQPQCVVTAPSGAQQEGEACGSATQVNIGCSTDPQGDFTNVTPGVPVFGSVGLTTAGRDVDWYRVVVPPTDEVLTVSITSETEVNLFLFWAPNDAGGATAQPGSCAGTVNQYVQSVGGICEPTTIPLGVAGLEGTRVFYVVVLPPGFDRPACASPGTNYLLTITTGAGEEPADCNENFIPDEDEIAANPALDCYNENATAPVMGGPDGILDQCQCVANWNRDGAVNTADITDFLSAWFADRSAGTANADVNCDGTTNTSDITAFLSLWFAARGNTNPFDNCP